MLENEFLQKIAKLSYEDLLRMKHAYEDNPYKPRFDVEDFEEWREKYELIRDELAYRDKGIGIIRE